MEERVLAAEGAAAGELDQLRELAADARDFVAASRAPNTLRAYRSDWRSFAAWCDASGREPLPAGPDTIALYLAALARSGMRAVTIQRRLSAISQAHQAAGWDPSPTSDVLVRQVMRGIRRQLGVAPRHQKAPLGGAELRRLLESTDAGSLAGLRDRALLLIGHLGAFRRSELVALDVEDVGETPDGLRLRVRRSKTDQEGEGTIRGLPRRPDPATCPVSALRRWREAAAIESGPLWRPVNRHDVPLPARLSDRAVALIVKRACRRAGLDPDRYAGHSLRSGFATAAAEAGAPERAIMRQGGWTSEAMVRRYIRSASVFRENAASYVDI